MKKMTTLAALFATAALVAPMASMAAAHTAAAPRAVDNWRSTDGTAWR
ncbi:MAG: OmpA family protein, partial [Betaproteobacteria bacterium]|nr:OmpA family protein [Betaproteobacteria bacterium]